MVPNVPRWTRMKARLPTIRPATPHTVATPNSVTRAKEVRPVWECPHWTVTEAIRAPR